MGLNGGKNSIPIKINIDQLPDIKCSCDNLFFTQIFRFKKMSAIQSPSGKEELLPLQIMVCANCHKQLTLGNDNTENDNILN